MTSRPVTEAEQVLRDPNLMIWDSRLQPPDRERLEEANAALLRMSDSRAIEINASGPFLLSKLAWKIAVYSHALQHRLVGLGDATALCWNNNNTLGAILSARALIETVAVIAQFERAVSRHLRAENIKALNDFVDNGTFATRDPALLAEFPEIESRNVLTTIGHLDKELPGLRAHYDRLSERCHPNAMGHVAMFSQWNHEELSVSFRNERHPEANAVSVLAAYLLLSVGDVRLRSIGELNSSVADLQHRLQPMT